MIAPIGTGSGDFSAFWSRDKTDRYLMCTSTACLSKDSRNESSSRGVDAAEGMPVRL